MATKNLPVGVDFGVINTADSFQRFIDTMDSVVSNHDTAVKLARLNFNESCGDAMGYRLSFDIRSITDEDAKAEMCENATALICRHTALKKSMVTNYRRVGEFFTDDTGEFTVPEYVHGFSVTALYEAIAKLKTVKAVKEAIESGHINSTMSAKTIRESCMNDVERDLAAKKEAEKAAKKEAEKEAAKTPPFIANGIPAFLVDASGNKIAKLVIEPDNGYSIDGVLAVDSFHIEVIGG